MNTSNKRKKKKLKKPLPEWLTKNPSILLTQGELDALPEYDIHQPPATGPIQTWKRDLNIDSTYLDEWEPLWMHVGYNEQGEVICRRVILSPSVGKTVKLRIVRSVVIKETLIVEVPSTVDAYDMLRILDKNPEVKAMVTEASGMPELNIVSKSEYSVAQTPKSLPATYNFTLNSSDWKSALQSAGVNFTI